MFRAKCRSWERTQARFRSVDRSGARATTHRAAARWPYAADAATGVRENAAQTTSKLNVPLWENKIQSKALKPGTPAGALPHHRFSRSSKPYFFQNSLRFSGLPTTLEHERDDVMSWVKRLGICASIRFFTKLLCANLPFALYTCGALLLF